jgi:tRNA(Ile)-lysidine synthase
LAGIAPVRGIFVRPLLDVDRADLRQWLRHEGLAWREDPTNSDGRFERNWIRSEVMPLLRERRPAVAEVLARLATQTRSDADALDALAAGVVERAEIDDSGLLLRTTDIAQLHDALFHRVVRVALRRAGVDPRWSDIEAVAALRVGGRTSCGPTTVWRLHEGIAVISDPAPVPTEQPLPRAGSLYAEPWGIRARIGPADAPAWRWRCVVPEDSGPLVFRSRRSGDRVRTKAGAKKVQDVLVDAKVPRPLRDLVPIVAGRASALAVVGLTTPPETASLVIDVEPAAPTWSKRSPWTRQSG